MASKRTLYKPASVTSGNVLNREKRKPLAQGRLVSQRTENTSEDKPSVLAQGRIHLDAGAGEAIRSRLNNSGRRISNEENVTDPRRIRQVSKTGSPRVAQPSHTLDLSDDEPNESLKKPLTSSVILVDASRQAVGPNTNEVDISLGQEPSPAKVICHTPEGIHSQLRNSGSVEDARKVAVDSFPSVNVLNYSGYAEHHSPRQMAAYKSPLVVKENVIAGSPMDVIAGKSDISKNLLKTLIDEGSSPGGYTQMSSKTEPNEKVHSDGHMKYRNKSGTDAITGLEKKRTHKGASLTSALRTKATGPMKAIDRSIMGTSEGAGLKPKATGGRTTTGGLKPKRTGSVSKYPTTDRGRRITPKPTKELKPRKTSETDMKYRLPITDVSIGKAKRSNSNSRTTPKKSSPTEGPGSSKKAPYTTSTPSAVDEHFHDGDMSAISQSNRFNLTPDVSSHLERKIDHEESHLSHRSQASHLSMMSNVSKQSSIATDDSRLVKTSETSQPQLDLLYSRFLQTLFLDSHSQKAFKEQEKNITADIHSMSELLTQKRKRKAELEQNLSRLKQVNIVDDALSVQETGLAPVMSGLSQLGQQYNTLSKALDTTRHQLATKGVYIPDNEEELANQLQGALTESEKLLGELSVMFRQQQPKVSSFADSINALSKSTSEEVTELIRCQESLAAATTLMIQLCSLRIQDTELTSN